MFDLNIADIIGLLSLLLGGGAAGGVLAWRYARQKAAAEAIEAEANAEKAKAEAQQAYVETNKEMQGLYQRLIDDVKKDREDQRTYISEQKQYINELKQDREDLRQDRNKMQKRISQLTDELEDVKRTQSRQGRQIEGMRPFLCYDMKCLNRQRVATSAGADIEGTVPGGSPADTTDTPDTVSGGSPAGASDTDNDNPDDNGNDENQ